MTVHLRKLCVGVANIQEMQDWQKLRLKSEGKLYHRTRNTPKRQDELLDGGSIYWITKGKILVRQRIIGFERQEAEDVIQADPEKPAKPHCLILLDPVLVAVEPRPHKIFQGWRYFDDDDVPPDISQASQNAIDDLGHEFAEELRHVGIVI